MRRRKIIESGDCLPGLRNGVWCALRLFVDGTRSNTYVSFFEFLAMLYPEVELLKKGICPICGKKPRKLFNHINHGKCWYGLVEVFETAWRYYKVCIQYIEDIGRFRNKKRIQKYKCKICDKEFNTRIEAVKHVYNEH